MEYVKINVTEEELVKALKRAANDIDLISGIAPLEAETVQLTLHNLGRKPGITIEDYYESLGMYAEDLISTVEETLENKKLAAADRRWKRAEDKAENRAEYNTTAIMYTNIRKTGDQVGTTRLGYDQAMSTRGLLECIINHLENTGAISKRSGHVVVQVENRNPGMVVPRKINREEVLVETKSQHPITTIESEAMLKLGWLLVMGKMAINIGEYPEVAEFLKRSFPSAVGLAGYISRFRAPLIPGGFYHSQRMVVKNCRAQIEEAKVRWGFDGCGTYDPAMLGHTDPVQFTATCWKTGITMKGMLIPDENCNDGLPEDQRACWHLDHLQVKSDNHKSKHKDLISEDEDNIIVLEDMYVGIMKQKVRWNQVRLGHQQIHQMRGANMDEQQWLGQVLAKRARAGIRQIVRGGPEALAGKTQDLNIRVLVNLLAEARSQGIDINPLDIPMIERVVLGNLNKALWPVAQGANIKGKFPIAIIDKNLEPGTVVLACGEVGSECAIWRHPTIAAQGLVTAVVAEPQARHLVGGAIIPNVIFMHPQELVVCMQGDDDGDEVGVSFNLDIIDMFKMRRDHEVYHIEPEGVKMSFAWDSERGLNYIAYDPMGPIGMVTYWMVQLIAVKDHDGARALKVASQEAIDSAKRAVRITDPYKAMLKENWHRDENGELHIHYKVDGEYVTDNFIQEMPHDSFPLEMFEEFYEQRMIAHDCYVETQNGRRSGNALGWRVQQAANKEKLDKAIAADNWCVSIANQTNDRHRNLVHYVHDQARKEFLKHINSFKSDSKLSARKLIRHMLALKGHVLEPLQLTWQEYHKKGGLKEKSGLVQWGKDYSNARKLRDPARRAANMELARQRLNIAAGRLTEREVLTVYEMEMTTMYYWGQRNNRKYSARKPADTKLKVYEANNPKNAINLISASSNKVLKLLGICPPEECQFMDSKRMDALLKYCFARPGQQYERMVHVIRSNTTHGEATVDGNQNPVHLQDCRCCVDRITSAVINRSRSERAPDKKVISDLCSQFNKAKLQPGPEWTDNDTEYWAKKLPASKSKNTLPAGPFMF